MVDLMATSRPRPEPAVDPATAADLYGLAPERFTEARNDLVKRLRAAGDREGAARAAKLRRPPATAWALNQVAREQPDLVAAVLDAGDALKASMEATLGGDASGLRRAQVAERDAVDAVLAAGASRLESAGAATGDPARQRMAATLRAAVVDGSVATLLRAGVLDGDHDLPGFGLDAPAWLAEPARTAGPGAGRRSAGPTGGEAPARAAGEAAERRASLMAEADRLAGVAEALHVSATEAEAAAAAARRAADQAAADAAAARRRAEAADTSGTSGDRR
jgi:hypothetical protein